MVSLFVALMLICAMVMPAYASDGFVPSISYKDHPEVVEDPELVDEEGETVYELDGNCLVITPVSEALEIPEDERDAKEELLVDVYEQLTDGTMKIPFEDHDPENMVIRDLIDATLICGEYHTDPSHVDELAKPGVCIEITFDLGVFPDTEVVVMVYLDGEWVPAEKVVNNGDGTVTCVFEQICPIAFCVEVGSNITPPQTGDASIPELIFWFVLLVGSFTAVVLLLLPRRKQKR